MVAYNFSREFAASVSSGVKRSTIRPERRPPQRHARPGERLQLYCDQRQPACRKLRDPDPLCVDVKPIEIRRVGHLVWVELNDNFVMGHRLDDLILREGFRSHRDFYGWFHARYGLPFRGVYVTWNPNA